MVACTQQGDTGDTVDPTVTLLAPTDGTEVLAGTEVSIEGTAADNVVVTRIEVLINDDARVATPGADWSYAWTPAVAGEYSISARAFDAAGNSAITDAVTITVLGDAGSVGGVITRTPAEDGNSGSGDAVEVAPVVPGDVFVVFKRGRPETRFGVDAAGPTTEAGVTFHADGGFSYEGLSFQQARAYPIGSGLGLYRTEGLTDAGTRDLVATLNASGAVAEAFPNWILSAEAVTPDDPLYFLQAWHYEQINMPEAWEIEDGSTNLVTVAVLDTGRIDHPDIEWSTQGANFVNWDVRLVDPTDPDSAMFMPDPTEGAIDYPFTNPGNSPHGLHVAGTIGATSNNEDGVAGINWNVELVPVKVLGGEAGSGTLAGIIEGAFWAAGVPDPNYGGHVNESPAQVINMSLGGNIMGECPASIDEFYGLFAELFGMISVTSAGNAASPSDINFPANCPSMITVGATGPTGARSYFSNYGAFVDVMVPGGDADYDHPVDANFYAGVLSTSYNWTADIPNFGFNQGTSMASPHVAGVVSLMLAQEPDLTLAEIRERLHNASYPLSAAECNVPASGFDGQNVCGAGLLDAAAALNGETVTTPTAVAYAIAYEGEVAPEIGLGNLAALELMAANRAEGSPLPNGDFAYQFDALAPGQYLIVGLELRDAATGISPADRVGFVEAVTVVSGESEEVDVVVAPVYATLR